MSDDPLSSSIVDLKGLMDWFQSQCNDDWEHNHGVTISTLDNPGWYLTVSLKNTTLEGCQMEEVSEGCDPNDDDHWIHCCVADQEFRGACDPNQLPRLIRIFESFRVENERDLD